MEKKQPENGVPKTLPEPESRTEPGPEPRTEPGPEPRTEPGPESKIEPGPVPGKKTLEELEEENRRLREEHEQLLREYQAALPLKERMYDKVPLTVHQMDVIIGLLLAALAAVVILGLLDR